MPDARITVSADVSQAQAAVRALEHELAALEATAARFAGRGGSELQNRITEVTEALDRQRAAAQGAARALAEQAAAAVAAAQAQANLARASYFSNISADLSRVREASIARETVAGTALGPSVDRTISSARASAATLANSLSAQAYLDSVARDERIAAERAAAERIAETRIGQATAAAIASREVEQAARDETLAGYRAMLESEGAAAAAARAKATAAQPVFFGRARSTVEAESQAAIRFASGSMSAAEEADHIRRNADAFATIGTAARAAGANVRAAGSALKGASSSAVLFTREGRHVVALFDEMARGQRGAMFSTMGAALRDAGSSALVLAAPLAAIAAVVGITELANHFGDLALKIQNAAAAAGMSVSDFSLLQRTMQLVDGDATKAERTMEMMANTAETAIADPMSKVRGAFDQLGISQEQLADGMQHPTALLDLLRHRFEEMGPSLQRTEIFRAALGRGFRELIPILERTDAEFAKLTEAAQRSGSVMSDEMAAKLAHVAVESHELGEAFTGLGQTIASSFAGTAFTETLRDWVEGMTNLIRSADDLVAKLPAIGQATRMMFGIMPTPPNAGAGAGAGQMSGDADRAAALVQQYENPKGLPYFGYGGRVLTHVPQNQFGFPQWEGAPTGRMLPNGKPEMTHAAGLYQFEPDTWNRYAAPLGVHDFSAESQRRVFGAAYAKEGYTPWRSNSALMAALANQSPFEQSGRTEGSPIGVETPYFDSAAATAKAQRAMPNGTFAALGAPVFDPQKMEAELQKNVQVINQETQLREAQFGKDAALAGEDLQKKAQVEQQKAAFVGQQVEREEALRQQYAQRAIALGNTDAAQRMAQNDQVMTRAIKAQTQVVTTDQAANQQRLRSFVETEDAKVALTDRGSRARIEAARAEVELAGNLNLINEQGRLSVKLAQEEAAAVRRATQDLEHTAKRTAAVLSSRERLATIQGRVAAIARPRGAEETTADRMAEIAQTIADTQVVVAAWEKVKEALIAQGKSAEEVWDQAGSHIDQAVEQAGTKIMQITAEIAADARKTADAWAKPFVDAFDNVGSGIENLAADILKLTPGKGASPFQKALDGIANSVTGGLTHDIADLGSKVAAKGFGAAGGEGLGQFLGNKAAGLFGISTEAPQIATIQANTAALISLTSVMGGHAAATGANATATAANTVATGADTVTTGANTVATGADTVTTGAQTVATGAHAVATGANTLAIVPNTLSTLANTIATDIEALSNFNPSIAGFKLERGGIIPSAAGGMVLGGSGSFAILHPQEMVLPAPISKGLQNIIGQGQAGGQPSNFNFNTEINGRPFMTHADAAEMHGSFEGFAKNYVRNRFGMRI